MGDATFQEKPDEMYIKGARKSLTSTKTLEKNLLPTADDIKKEQGDDAKAAAETALQEKLKSLAPVTPVVKQRLPTMDDINAEQKAVVMSNEILTDTVRRLSRTSTLEKVTLPTAADIQTEKKDQD